MKTSITSLTEGQRKQYKRFIEDAADRVLEEVRLGKDELQRLIEHGGEFQADIVASIMKHAVSNQFADEEVKSIYGYPAGYSVKGITEQANVLRELFPGIGYADQKLADQPLPPGAEGWFAIPRWEAIAPTYNGAVEKVLALLKQSRNGRFYNYREGKLGPEFLRQHERTALMLKKIGEQQEGYDLLVVPCQFGLRHRGRSVRRAREVFAANEFGLGAFAIGCLLLTHPEREIQWKQLHLDCPGDECSPEADGRFSYAPDFHWLDGRLRFYPPWVGHAYGRYGSASGFPPQ